MSIVEFLSQPIWQRLGLTLVHFLWQGLAVAVLVGALVRVLRLKHGNARYAAYLLAFAAMIVCPVVTFTAIDIGISPNTQLITEAESTEVIDIPPYTALPAVDILPEAEIPISAIPTSVNSIPLSQRISGWLNVSMPWVLVIWMVGVIVLSVRLLMGFVGVYRWRHNLEPLPERLTQRIASLSDGLGMRGFSRVFISPSVLQAMAVGYLRPMVLLPAAMLTQMQPEMLEAVIAHELAHIRRFDLWVNLAQRVTETLLFYHPAVWWLSNCLRNERELCCDALAVKVTGRRLTYAKTLESVSRNRFTAKQPVLAAGLGQDNKPTLSRVRHILGLTPAQRNCPFWLAGVIAVVFLAAIVIPTTLALTNQSDENSMDLESVVVEGIGANRDKFECGYLAWSSKRIDTRYEGPRGDLSGRYEIWWDGKKMATKYLQDQVYKDPEGHYSVKKQQGGNSYDGGVLSRKPDFSSGNWLGPQITRWRGLGSQDRLIRLYRKQKNSSKDWSVVESNGVKIIRFTTKVINQTDREYGAYSIRDYDPSKGYGLVNKEWYNPNGTRRLKHTVKLQEVISGGWFPVEVDFKSFAITDGHIFSHNHYALDIERCSFNDKSVLPARIFKGAIDKQLKYQEKLQKYLAMELKGLSRVKEIDKTDKVKRGARQAIEIFITAAMVGDLEQAAEYAHPNRLPAGQIADLAEVAKGQNLWIMAVLADDSSAIAVSSVIRADHDRTGPLVFLLDRAPQDGQDNWWVHDIDMETPDSAEGELKKFLEKHPKAQKIPHEKQPAVQVEGEEPDEQIKVNSILAKMHPIVVADSIFDFGDAIVYSEKMGQMLSEAQGHLSSMDTAYQEKDWALVDEIAKRISDIFRKLVSAIEVDEKAAFHAKVLTWGGYKITKEQMELIHLFNIKMIINNSAKGENGRQNIHRLIYDIADVSNEIHDNIRDKKMATVAGYYDRLQSEWNRLITIKGVSQLLEESSGQINVEPPTVQAEGTVVNRVEGRVVDLGGSPIIGAAVQWILAGERDKNLYLFDDDLRWGEKNIVLTDAQGRFAFEISGTEDFGVHVKANGFAQKLMVNLDFSKDAEKLKVIMLLPESKVFGKVVKDGKAVPDARVSAHIFSKQLQEMLSSPWPIMSVHTDEDGYYSIAGLPAGELSIGVNSSLAKGNLNMFQKTVQLEQGQEVELNFGDEIGFTLTGVVTMEEKPIEAASVTAHQSDGLCFKCVRTNSKGEFRITGIPEGDYRIFTDYSTRLDPKTFMWSQWSQGESFFDVRNISVNGDLTISIDLSEKKPAVPVEGGDAQGKSVIKGGDNKTASESKGITGERLLEKMLESRAKAKNLQFVAEYDIHNAVYGEAMAEQMIKSMREKGVSKQLLQMQMRALKNIPEYRFQILKCTVNNLGHAKIERTAGSYDSSGSKVLSGEKNVASWDGMSGVDFNQRRDLPGFATIKDVASFGASKQGQPWRTFTGTFIAALSKAISSGRQITVNKMEDGDYNVVFEDDILKRVATVDPSKGYTCTLEEYYRKEKLSHRRTARYEEVTKGVWFPVSGETASYADDGSLRSKSSVATRQIKVNEPGFNRSYFEVDLPEGTEVRDHLEGKNYVVGSDKTYELPRAQKSSLKTDAKKVDDTATEDTTDEVDPSSWQKGFDAVYRLDDNEVLKWIAPPFIPEREHYFLNQSHGKSSNTRYHTAIRYIFHWDGELSNWGAVSGSVILRLDSVLESVIRLGSFEYQAPDKLLHLPMPGDWIVRKGASKKELLAALEKILWEDTGREIRFEKRSVERQVIVATGHFKFRPPSETYENKSVHLYADELGPDEGGGGGTADSVNDFLLKLGDRVDMPVVDHTEPSNIKIPYRHYRSSYLKRIKDNAEKLSKLDTLLINLTRQTELQFRIERRPVEVWFVTEQKKTNKPITVSK